MTNFGPEILSRIFQLIKRDALAEELNKALIDYATRKKGIIDRKSYIKLGLENSFKGIEKTISKISKKWGVSVYIPERLYKEGTPETIPTMWTISGCIRKIDKPSPVRILKATDDIDVIIPYDLLPSNERPTGPPLYHTGKDILLGVTVNPSLVDGHNIEEIKEAFSKVLSEHLKRKERLPGRSEKAGFYYDCSRRTFDNYLRWYDIHVKERLSFRLIAFLEEIRSKNIATYEKSLEQFRSKKWKVGRPIKGEDRVRHGVRTIWETIHRESYSQKKVEPIIEDWSCPVHGHKFFSDTKVSEKPRSSCKYCQALYDRFDRLYPMSKGKTKTMIDQDIVFYTRIGRLPRRPKSTNPDEDGTEIG